MDMALGADDEVLAFGRWALRPRARTLSHDGRAVELGARAFDLLAALLRADGELLTKDQLMRQAWPGVIVEENNLHTQIGAIRRVLGAERDAIITVAGRGYRFGLAVQRRGAASGGASLSNLSIAVLPFSPIGGCRLLAALAEGVTDTLTTDLARVLSGGTVASRSSATAIRGHAATVRQIGAALGVRYVLEGSVAADKDLVRVNAQLIDAAADTHLWAERFDPPRGAGMLAAQDAIVARLTRLVAVRVVLAEAQRVATEPDGGAAQIVLRAQGLALASRMSAEGAAASRALFEQALTLDPDNLEAAAGLAQVESYAVVNGHVPAAERAQRLAAVEALAARVLAVQPAHLGALRAHAVALRAVGRFEDAIVATRAVLEACPGDPPACREMGLCLLYLGEPDEAARWFRQAELSGPGDPARWTWLQGLGRALLHAGQDEEAVGVLRMLVEVHPDWPFGHGLLAAALLGMGAEAAARERFAELVRRAPAAEGRALSGLVPVPAERLAAAYRAGDARLAERFAALEAMAAAEAGGG
jgi:TolB-like protein/Flp pilus assembly protein TadD